MDFKNVEEWTDDDRMAALEQLHVERANYYAQSGQSIADIAKAAAKAQVLLEIMWAAQRECVRRYLDATGRGQYGIETLESEIRFFERIGEVQIISRSKPSKIPNPTPLRPQ